MTGALLYASTFPRALRIGQCIALAVSGFLLLSGLILLAGVLLTMIGSITGRVVVVAILLVLLVLLGALGVLTWRGTRLAMTVTTDGIEVRGYLRDRWIPWTHVARIETGSHWYWRRATCIVAASGDRVLATVTSYQFLFFRGDPYDPAARDPQAHQVPTLAAIDAHQRFLRGEFSR